MGIKEKIANAKKTNWIAEGFSEAEIKTIIELAKISAQIEKSRLDLGMTQKEFADYMGVTQSMVSKWESREYNFTIRSLNEIYQKLGISLSIETDSMNTTRIYKIVRWDEEKVSNKRKQDRWMNITNIREAIA